MQGVFSVSSNPLTKPRLTAGTNPANQCRSTHFDDSFSPRAEALMVNINPNSANSDAMDVTTWRIPLLVSRMDEEAQTIKSAPAHGLPRCTVSQTTSTATYRQHELTLGHHLYLLPPKALSSTSQATMKAIILTTTATLLAGVVNAQTSNPYLTYAANCPGATIAASSRYTTPPTFPQHLHAT